MTRRATARSQRGDKPCRLQSRCQGWRLPGYERHIAEAKPTAPRRPSEAGQLASMYWPTLGSRRLIGSKRTGGNREDRGRTAVEEAAASTRPLPFFPALFSLLPPVGSLSIAPSRKAIRVQQDGVGDEKCASRALTRL